LDALKLDAESGSEGLHKEGLRETRHALKEDVAARQERD
jgi:hypothetical protein